MDQIPFSSFHLLDERIQRWIWDAGWTELKDAQERAIASILKPNAEHDVIISAATASGKTEAAFFPILTRLLSGAEDECVLYVSPLKALINDQWSRLERLCETLEVPVMPWHGDIGDGRKKRFLRRPRGCLLITPESLEGLLIRHGHGLSGLFAGLQFIVVDELHAFIDSPRGTQLQSLMHRIEVALKRRVRRIGLSATLGEMRLAAEFLRPRGGEGVDIIESKDGGQEVRVLVKGYYDHPPRHSGGESEDLQATGHALQEEDGLPDAMVAIGRDLFTTLRGSNNLVFPNSRGKVELIADLLRRACEEAGLPNEFWPHHGSLAKEIREETEAALKHGERPATAIATTTLELGIDIGAVKSVAQIGPAPSVASLRQRLGRSGRRRGEAAILRSYCIESEFDPHAPLSDRLREGLVQTVAQIHLLTRGWFEPPRTEAIDASTLVQQLLSLIAQYGGVTAAQAWQVLSGGGVFANVERSDFLELLRELGRREILQQDEEGLLLPAPNGERLINHFSFLAAFQSDEEFRVVSRGRPLGSLPISRPLDEGSYVIFAGRRWRVVTCNQTDKAIEVVPARGGKVPTFDGMAGRVHDGVRAEMRSILESDAVPALLDSTAKAMLIEARDSYRAANLGHDRIQQVGRGAYVFTWRGDCANETLALMLAHRGLRAQNDGLVIEIEDSAVERVLAALHEIANDPPPDALALVSKVENKWRRKWDWVLPERLLSASYASGELDVPGAVEAAGDLVRPARTAP